MADALGRRMGHQARLVLCGWDQILSDLDRGDIDLGLNGYEYTPQRARHYAASLPYYIYELGLCVREGSPIQSWAALKQPAAGGRKPRVGVLGGSSADRYVTAEFGSTCEVVRFDGTVETFLLIENGQLDATVQDLPPLEFYLNRLKRYPKLRIVGGPAQPGYYVAYARQSDQPLVRRRERGDSHDSMRTARSVAFTKNMACGMPSRNACRTSGKSGRRRTPPPKREPSRKSGPSCRCSFARRASRSCLAFLSMPLAVAIGLAVALVRAWPSAVLGGDGARPSVAGRFVRGLMTLYVEIVRGTPLAFQLFVVYFVLPDFGVAISAFWSGVFALAVNYSAYEAEIMRLGIQSIPVGQMEAALSLGMSRGLAVRRIILPQAIRTVIPATANDFIALYKDTAVCSVIAVEELSKQYSVAAKSTGLYLHMAVVASVLYLAMS